MIKRRKTRQVKIGKVKVGGGAPISIQSMTKTDTKNVRATLAEIEDLTRAGCEIVRIAVKERASINPLRKIVEKSKLPIEADIHFIPQLALDAIGAGAAAIRLNPGNINKESDITRIAKGAKAARIPIRIGVNSGSLASKGGMVSDSMVKSALSYAKILEKNGFRDIMISLKSSDTLETIEGRCQVDLLDIVNRLQDRLSTEYRVQSTESPITIAVMGCEVNGPGEAAHADIGIAAGKGSGVLFRKGKIVKRLKESEFINALIKEVKAFL